MEEWWISLDMFDKVVWVIALTTSLIFLIQTIMTFVGMESGGMDADFDGDMTTHHDGALPFELFTFRNFINFFFGFSWTIIAFKKQIPNTTLLVLVGALVGALLVGGMMYLIYLLLRLQQSGNMKIEDAVGKTAEVYLTIPGNRNGMGKIHVRIQGTLRELDAISASDTFSSGSLVKVIGVVEDRILLVEKLNT